MPEQARSPSAGRKGRALPRSFELARRWRLQALQRAPRGWPAIRRPPMGYLVGLLTPQPHKPGQSKKGTRAPLLPCEPCDGGCVAALFRNPFVLVVIPSRWEGFATATRAYAQVPTDRGE